ncbi:MAG: relaxase/mobilization nuclease domain-containing protein [Geminicoccales bacterium]
MNAAHLVAPVGVPFSYESYVKRADLKRSAVFADVFHPAKLVYWMPMTLSRADDYFAVVNFLRGPARGSFNAEHRTFLQAIGPHLRRASRIHLEFRRLGAIQSCYEEALSSLDHGVILLSRNLRVTFMNAAAQTIVEKEYGLRCRRGRLEAARPSERGKLDRQIAEARGAADVGPVSSVFRLSSPTGKILAGMIFPIGEGRRSLFLEQPSVMILFRTKSVDASNMMNALVHLYGLSPRQAEIAVMLMQGMTLPRIEAGIKATGRKLEKPVYVYSLSWHPDEQPDKATMVEAARESLEALGVEDRQALIVCHNDEPHPQIARRLPISPAGSAKKMRQAEACRVKGTKVSIRKD